MNTMDRCFEVEDLVVPEDYDQTEMMSSPDSWPQWGITGFGGPCLPKNKFDSNMTHEKLTFNGGESFYSSTDMAADSNNKRSESKNSSMSQELYNNGGSLLWIDQADFQQFTEEEARINHMDDIFFDSLLEEDLSYDSSMPHDTTILDNNTNIFEGQREVLHTRSTSKQTHDVESHDQSIGYLKYLNTNAFSPSTDWGNGEALATCRDTSNQNSTQESVLKDLERVSTLFSEKTRICLRDAFYRLAESSKDTVNCQDGELMTTANEDTSRYRETEPSDSKTTSIDRVVGSLMLSNLDFEDQQVVYCCQHRKTDYNDDAVVPGCGIDDRFASLYPTFVI